MLRVMLRVTSHAVRHFTHYVVCHVVRYAVRSAFSMTHRQKVLKNQHFALTNLFFLAMLTYDRLPRGGEIETMSRNTTRKISLAMLFSYY
jgi:hypothetical protein